MHCMRQYFFVSYSLFLNTYMCTFSSWLANANCVPIYPFLWNGAITYQPSIRHHFIDPKKVVMMTKNALSPPADRGHGRPRRTRKDYNDVTKSHCGTFFLHTAPPHRLISAFMQINTVVLRRLRQCLSTHFVPTDL